MAPANRSSTRKATARQTTARQTTARHITARQTTARHITARQKTARHTTDSQTTAQPPIPNNVLVELTVDHDKSCMLCHHKDISETLYGKLYQLNDIIVHYFCILLSSKAAQNGLDHQGIWGFLLEDIVSEIQRGAKVICCYCKKKGATISCSGGKCRKVFHLPCGTKNGSIHQYFESFKSFCRQHRPKQKVDLAELQNTSAIECAICKNDVKPSILPSSLWAPCCKRNAWFHRKCVQELALNAGYFFKCPLCNNVEIFKTSMLHQGIYIPSRDASWETVPNAFAELLERHSTCNAKSCLCPYQKKRNYSNEDGPWEIILCHICGSNGTHRFCNSIKCDQGWCCPACQCVADEANTSKQSQLELPDIGGCSGISIRFEERLLSQRRKDSERLMHISSCNNNSRAQSNNDIIIISDDESNDSSLSITYIDPPRRTHLPVAQIPQMQLPIITSFHSIGIITSIDLTLDDEN